MSEIRQILAAGQKLVEQRRELAPSLAEATGLSIEGVEHALLHHLEREASDEELERLGGHAGSTSVVAVVLSANVFVGALRAIAMARAAAPRVIVRPSRREPVFARALVEAIADPSIVLDESFDVGTLEQGEIHVYGRDETIAEVRAKARPGVRVRGHGSGMGVAWIDGDDAGGLALDVVAFDQRGCLSPRIALVRGDLGAAEAFAHSLHAALEQLQEQIPRGDVPSEDRAAIARYSSTMTYAGSLRVGAAHVVGVAPLGAPLVLAPTYRTVHVAPCSSAEEARAMLAPLEKGIVTVGAATLEAARVVAPRHARLSLLGRMQRPPLDGPVDLRESV